MLTIDDKVYTTINYAMFTDNKGQPLHRKHKGKVALRRSLKEWGSNAAPILIDRLGRITDGHNRAIQNMILGQPIRYLVIKTTPLLLRELSATASPWTNMDYIESEAQLNPRGAYAEFLAYFNGQPHNIGVLQAFSGGLSTTAIRRGKLDVSYTPLAIKVSVFERTIATLGEYCTSKGHIAESLSAVIFSNSSICGEEFLMKLRLFNPPSKLGSRAVIGEYFQDVLKREVA